MFLVNIFVICWQDLRDEHNAIESEKQKYEDDIEDLRNERDEMERTLKQ